MCRGCMKATTKNSNFDVLFWLVATKQSSDKSLKYESSNCPFHQIHVRINVHWKNRYEAKRMRLHVLKTIRNISTLVRTYKTGTKAEKTQNIKKTTKIVQEFQICFTANNMWFLVFRSQNLFACFVALPPICVRTLILLLFRFSSYIRRSNIKI